MSPSELEKWMTKNDVTAVDIAAALKIHPRTVERFLDGENVFRSTKARLTEYVAKHASAQTARHKEAVG